MHANDSSPQVPAIQFGRELAVSNTQIAGLRIIDLPVHGDARGWFKEAWNVTKLRAAGLPPFAPVQQNISMNGARGVTRGLHAEPWDKYVTVGSGSVFGAWCDLREGSATYGRTVTATITPDRAVWVPRGVANGFQALEDNTVYSYLVNAHWSPEASYSFVNLADPTLNIAWPIPLDQATCSEKDHEHPLLADATPVAAKPPLVVGAGGQLGRALTRLLPHSHAADRATLDLRELARPGGVERACEQLDFAQYSAIINAAAFTDVDAAQERRAECWEVNAQAVAALASIANRYQLPLVQVSTDYVFDGTATVHRADEPPSPINVYGQAKAAGEQAAVVADRNYVVRTSWVFGEGRNFIAAMARLAAQGVAPSVVDDQIGRPTNADDLARAIAHLLGVEAPSGVYHCSNSGEPVSWYTLAQTVYRHCHANPARVSTTSTQEFYGDRPHAPRPEHSTLDLSSLEATGFHPRPWEVALAEYVGDLQRGQKCERTAAADAGQPRAAWADAAHAQALAAQNQAAQAHKEAKR